MTYWFEKAGAQIKLSKANRAGLLATQTIRIGGSRKVLERIKDTGEIFMAWSDRPWVIEGAAVRVSMEGFDGGQSRPTPTVLDGVEVADINPDLTGRAADVTTARVLNENLGLAFIGDTKKGPFDIDDRTAREMLNAVSNPNGRSNSDVVLPWINARDVVQQARGMWIIDFGVDTPLEQAAMYELPFEYVRTHVKPIREAVRNDRERRYWWLHARPAPKLRTALNNLRRCIVTPEVSKHRLFMWVRTGGIIDHKTYVFAREDDYFFGVLHSRPHEVWALLTGGRHGDGSEGGRPVYNLGRSFETFPFPWPPGTEPWGDPRVEAIAEAARELVEMRDRWLNPEGAAEAELRKRTMTNLYNQRPTWLDLVHRKLDEAVLDAYSWPHDLTDEQILERLLELNLERAQATSSPAAMPSLEPVAG